MAQSNLARAFHDPESCNAEFELLLPWYAAGTLDRAASRRISAALAANPKLAREYAAIRREQAAILDAVEQPDGPSLRPLIALFAAIEADSADPAKIASLKLGGTTRYAPRKMR